jgi:hypothetical protein
MIGDHPVDPLQRVMKLDEGARRQRFNPPRLNSSGCRPFDGKRVASFDPIV